MIHMDFAYNPAVLVKSFPHFQIPAQHMATDVLDCISSTLQMQADARIWRFGLQHKMVSYRLLPDFETIDDRIYESVLLRCDNIEKLERPVDPYNVWLERQHYTTLSETKYMRMMQEWELAGCPRE